MAPSYDFLSPVLLGHGSPFSAALCASFMLTVALYAKIVSLARHVGNRL